MLTTQPGPYSEKSPRPPADQSNGGSPRPAWSYLCGNCKGRGYLCTSWCDECGGKGRVIR